MWEIEFTPKAAPVSDFSAEDIVADIVNTYGGSLAICNEVVLSAIITAIAEGRVPYDRVRFVFDGRVVEHNRFGSIQDWPNGFGDMGVMLAERRLRAQMKRRKAEKGKITQAPNKAGCSSAVPCRNCPGCANCAPENF